MTRRRQIIISFVLAAALTVIGSAHCAQKLVPVLRYALWFPLPFLLGAYELFGIFLELIQFLVFAGIFALAVRRWPARRVLSVMLGIYALYAGVMIVIFKPR